MAKNQNTFAKRKREMDKKMKADEKRARKKKRKESPGDFNAFHQPSPDDEELDSESEGQQPGD